MVTLTDSAIALIRRLTAAQEVGDHGGVRIALGPARGSLSVQMAHEPRDGDQVVDADGARLFLDWAAARILDGSKLDASVRDGSVRFAIL
ncbi:HesB/IscA family protein [Micromonospora sp. CPCC 206061]|uniref:HesB/IscA family protein n=1 Tax=Micromonospora sp. CPCC 206061 TaxID=3122410 RepID=UPI002FEF072A